VLAAATPASEIITITSATMITQPVKNPSAGFMARAIQAYDVPQLGMLRLSQ